MSESSKLKKYGIGSFVMTIGLIIMIAGITYVISTWGRYGTVSVPNEYYIFPIIYGIFMVVGFNYLIRKPEPSRLRKQGVGIFVMAIGLTIIIPGIIYSNMMRGVYRAVFVAPEVIQITIGAIFMVIGFGYMLWNGIRT
ncbi:MAG: hypothetical protein ACXABO_15680 [Promethearchaeota archaeon]|jgi:hypothetical protein